MDKSHRILADVQKKIDRMGEDPSAESFLRNLLILIVNDKVDTPMWVVGALAQTLVECRKVELKEIAEGN